MNKVSVEVQHKYYPTIECPENMEVTCDYAFDEDNLKDYFGTATGTDVCGVDVIETDAVIDINTWNRSDHKTFCSYWKRWSASRLLIKIYIYNPEPFTSSDIDCSEDKTIYECGTDKLSPDNLSNSIE
ncbi:MAG: hypothetical protein R2771_07360 [Saprospiraceae bacterium]